MGKWDPGPLNGRSSMAALNGGGDPNYLLNGMIFQVSGVREIAKVWRDQIFRMIHVKDSLLITGDSHFVVESLQFVPRPVFQGQTWPGLHAVGSCGSSIG